jgi:ATP phosphoribosyltransferase
MEKLKMILPTGSLLERARTDEFLRQAEWDVVGYALGLRSYRPVIRNVDIELSVARAQEIPELLYDNEADIGIDGDDWVEEWAIAGKKVTKKADLEFGYVRVGFIIPQTHVDVSSLSDLLNKYKGKKLRCSTEYLNTTLNAFLMDKTYKELYGKKIPIISMKGKVIGNNPHIIIRESFGTTEGKIPDFADVIVDNTSSGRTLLENGLKMIEKIRESTAGLYASPDALKDTGKAKQIDFIKVQLLGVVNARKDRIALINASNEKLPDLMEYLKKEGLYAKEPTIVKGEEWSEVITEIPRLQVPTILKKLRELGIDDVAILPPQMILKRNKT